MARGLQLRHGVTRVHLSLKLAAALWALSPASALAAASGKAREVPALSQLHPAGAAATWHGENRCGPTAVAMIYRAHGLRDDLSDAQPIDKLDLLDSKLNEGTSGPEVIAAPHAGGLNAEAHLGVDETWLRAQLRGGAHVIAIGNPEVFESAGVTHPEHAHYLVIAGERADGLFEVHDRATGAKSPLDAKSLERFVMGYEVHPVGSTERGHGGLIAASAPQGKTLAQPDLVSPLERAILSLLKKP